MPKRIVTWSLLAVLTFAACTGTGSSTPSPQASPEAAAPDAGAPASPTIVARRIPMRLVVLGDGYSAGQETSAPKLESWPAQLQQISRHTDMPIRVVANLATPGVTSEDVVGEQLPLVAGYEPDLVVVQVGINDVAVTRTSLDDYRSSLSDLLDGLLGGLRADRIYALTTPDHRLTRFGQGLPGTTDVEELNDVLREVAHQRSIVVIDIAPVYELVLDDPSFVVPETPYPTARQYAGWAELIGQEISLTLGASQP